MECKAIEEFREAYDGRAYVNSRKRGQVKKRCIFSILTYFLLLFLVFFKPPKA